MYEKVPIEECWANTGKDPIGTRWVDVFKGDDANPEYRSRLVAQEIKTDKREDLFAATPPVEVNFDGRHGGSWIQWQGQEKWK